MGTSTAISAIAAMRKYLCTPYEEWYSIGVGNPKENTNDIKYNDYYTLNPTE